MIRQIGQRSESGKYHLHGTLAEILTVESGQDFRRRPLPTDTGSTSIHLLARLPSRDLVVIGRQHGNSRDCGRTVAWSHAASMLLLSALKWLADSRNAGKRRRSSKIVISSMAPTGVAADGNMLNSARGGRA
jgi:hypothetical protein